MGRAGESRGQGGATGITHNSFSSPCKEVEVRVSVYTHAHPKKLQAGRGVPPRKDKKRRGKEARMENARGL